MIEDFLDYFETLSSHLLNHIVNMTDCNGNTAMHYAISYSNFDAASVLLDSKVCDVNKLNKVRLYYSEKYVIRCIKYSIHSGWILFTDVGIVV